MKTDETKKIFDMDDEDDEDIEIEIEPSKEEGEEKEEEEKKEEQTEEEREKEKETKEKEMKDRYADDETLAMMKEDKKHEKVKKDTEPEPEDERIEKEFSDLLKVEKEYKGNREKAKAEGGNPETEPKLKIFALRTTANREDQVMDFITSNIQNKKLDVYSIIRPHGMRSYIFLEAKTKQAAEVAAFNVPYARGILPKEIQYSEIEHMLEQVKKDMNIIKNDIVEIISGPFKREKAKITRIDRAKEEVVVELLEAAVPIPITVKMDAVKVIRRDSEDVKE